MYSFCAKVRFSESDKNGLLSIPSAIHYFLDCSSFQSEELGRGVDYLREKKIAWWLSAWQIEFFRMPAMGEEIRIGTWAYHFSGINAYRNFLMEDAAGRILLSADSAWFSVDMEKRCPRRPKPEEVDVYMRDEEVRHKMNPMEKRLVPTGSSTTREEIVIGREHLDSNHHVNNVRYIEFALALSGLTQRPRALDVRYKKGAFLGDILYPEVYEGNDRLFVVFINQTGETCSIVRIMK